MIKNIIFDWSGVVNDNVKTVHKVVNKLFRHFGVKEISFEEFKREWEMPYMKFYNKYLPELTLEEEQKVYDRLIKKVELVKVYPGLPEVLRKFKSLGIRMFVNSSDLSDTLIKEIHDFGLDGVFSEVLTNVYDKLDALDKLIHKHNLVPRETVFIGDTSYEVECGKKLGTKTLAVTWGYQTLNTLKKAQPDYLVSSIDELSEAILNG
jgi:phosphoglycolate phosphatase